MVLYSPLNKLDTSASSSYGHGYGYGHGSFGGGSSLFSGTGSSCFTVDVCPDLVMALAAAAGAAGVYFLYTAITVKAGRRFPTFEYGNVWDFVLNGRDPVSYARPALQSSKCKLESQHTSLSFKLSFSSS